MQSGMLPAAEQSRAGRSKDTDKMRMPCASWKKIISRRVDGGNTDCGHMAEVESSRVLGITIMAAAAAKQTKNPPFFVPFHGVGNSSIPSVGRSPWKLFPFCRTVFHEQQLTTLNRFRLEIEREGCLVSSEHRLPLS